MRVSCLELHAGWLCRHAGACCRAGWAIPVEGPAFESVSVHFGNRDAGQLFVTGGPLPAGAAAMLATRDGACVFHEGRRCAIHRELGPAALPSACRQFPRMALRDGRGTFVTLSHFCPTAAALLVGGGRPAIVEAPPSLALQGGLEGLDATAALPPLLRPALLTDLEGYGEWERRSVDLLASGEAPADEAIARIGTATSLLTLWTPGGTSLAGAVADAFERARPVAAEPDPAEDARRFATAAAAVPVGLNAPPLPADFRGSWRMAQTWMPDVDRATRAFLAAHLFANWIAYYGTGLLTVVEWVRICLSVLRVEAARQQRLAAQSSVEQRLLVAIQQADLLLVHLMDARALARNIEREGLPTPNEVRSIPERAEHAES